MPDLTLLVTGFGRVEVGCVSGAAVGRDGWEGGRRRRLVMSADRSLSAEEDGESGVGAAGTSGQVVDAVDAVFGGGGEHADDGPVGVRAGPGSVAAPDFAVHGAGSDGLLYLHRGKGPSIT